jgi:hypothetical protein
VPKGLKVSVPLQLPGRKFCSLVEFNGNIYLFGGLSQKGYKNTLYKYSISKCRTQFNTNCAKEKNTWKKVSYTLPVVKIEVAPGKIPMQHRNNSVKALQ